MAVLGILVLLAAVGVSLDVLWENTTAMDIDALGRTFSLSPGWLFVIGVAVGVVGLLGLVMFLGGLGRARQRRLAVKESHGEAAELAGERDRLAKELEKERLARVQAEESRAQQAEQAKIQRVETRQVEKDNRRAGVVTPVEGETAPGNPESETASSGLLARLRDR
jgi:hypothetical protein